MNNNNRGHHIYHAHALGVAGKIVRPVAQVIDSQASTSLSPSGGHGSHHVENFEIKGIVSFSSAFVEVGGSYDDDNNTHTTVSSAVIENLNIMGIITADRIVARLSAYHPIVAKASATPAVAAVQSAASSNTQNTAPAKEAQDIVEPSIVPMGSYFENLRIAGRLIDIQLATQVFSEHDTFSKVRNAQKNGLSEWVLCKKLGNAKGISPSLDQFCTGLDQLPDTHGIYICSPAYMFGEELKNKGMDHGLNVFGSVIYLPSFGVIHIAELIIERHSRRLNMLRLQLGSPTQGDLTAGAVFANGSTYPPT